MTVPTLRPRLVTRTERLSVRPLRSSDYDAWRSANEQHPPAQNIYDSGPRAAADLARTAFRAMLRRNDRLQRSDTYYSFGLFDRKEEHHIGVVTVQVIARMIMQLGWIGWRVVGQHRGKGYAREGVEAVIQLAFRELALHRLEAGIEPGNRISVRLARSLGMRRQASHKKCLYLRNEWVDLDVYVTNSEDWGMAMTPAVGMKFGDRRVVEGRL